MDLSQQGGGGAWVAEVPSAARPAPLGCVAEVHWLYHKWTVPQLMQHSTCLEAENGTQVVQCLIDQGMEDIILVMDNQAWTSAGRNLSCHVVEMAEQISALAQVLDAALHARLFIVFHPREDGTEADSISKAYIVRADRQLHLAVASASLQQRGFLALTDDNCWL